MNAYNYGYNRNGEPMVPPRRKRSLNTRMDSNPNETFGFQNRMRRNFSTEHITGNESYATVYKPTANYYMGQPLQQSRNYNYNYNPNNPNNFALSAAQGPSRERYMSSPQLVSAPKVPVLAHQDYFKYAPEAHVQYNPYNTKFNPTLMARPSLEPFQSTAIATSIAGAIARGRDPNQYSSKEQLNESLAGNYQTKTPPERPPPPRFNSRSSMENLSSQGEMQQDAIRTNNQFRDRRSMSPSRVSPNQQRAYSVRRSTSPLSPAILGSSTPLQSLSRCNSRNSINQNYAMGEFTSRMSRSPSPLRSSHFSYSTNQLANRDYQPLARSASTSKYLNRTTSILRGDMERNGPLASSLLHSNSSFKGIGKSLNLCSNGLSSHSTTCGTNQSHNVTKPNLFSDSPTNKVMDSLHVPGGGQQNQLTGESIHSQLNNNSGSETGLQRQTNPQFSEAFTDHCDQYKSLTSKILAKQKAANCKSENCGDFTEYDEGKITTLAEILNQNQSTLQKEMNSEQNFDKLKQSTRENTPCDFEQETLLNQEFMARTNETRINEDGSLVRVGENNLQCVQTAIRRCSSSNGLTAQQRKGSLPSDYLANSNSIALSDEWSREKVADLAHQARQKMNKPPDTMKKNLHKITNWFGRQFVFLLIAGLNIMLAYVFYNLLSMLPSE